MALDAPGLASEDAESFLLLGRQRLRVPGQASVQWRLVGDEGRFVGLDRLTPDSRELGPWVQGRAEGGRDELTVHARVIINAALQSHGRRRRQRAQNAIGGVHELVL